MDRTKTPTPSRLRYGSIGCAADTCPTCRGTGRIPRGHEDMLVAVIPCNDVRLEPRRTLLYMCISMALCLVVCSLILFFLCPRSVILTPACMESVVIHFTKDSIEAEVTNIVNITNENFLPIELVEIDVQGLILKKVVGSSKICPVVGMPSRSQLAYTIPLALSITDLDLNTYCKSSMIHVLFLELQLTINISYLSHNEQQSLNIYEYFDCGSNSTVPHPLG